MKKLLLKLKSLLDLLLSGVSKSKSEKQESPNVSSTVLDQKTVQKEVEKIVDKHLNSVDVKKSSPDPFGKFDNGYPEPQSTGMIGTIESFLWKPESENTGNPIVLVSCNDVPTNELFIEVLNSKGNAMKSVSPESFSRGNQLPNQKFARISFRMGASKKAFKAAAPLKVQFYQVVEGKKHILKLKNGKSHQLIKDPSKRIEWS